MTAAQDAPRYQRDFTPGELKARRQALVAGIGEDSIGLIQGAGTQRSLSLFRQTNEMYYLTGIEVPHAYLILEGGTGRSVLYLPRMDFDLERSQGPTLSSDQPDLVRELVGIEDVKPTESLGKDILAFANRRSSRRILTPISPAEGAAMSRIESNIATAKALADPWDGRPTREMYLVALLRSRFPQISIGDLSPLLDRLRLIKTPREQELLRVAGQLTAEAVTEAMRSTAPGVTEYELAAVAMFIFLEGGARGEAYRAIVATGHNAWFGHYSRLDSTLSSGELVLMDHAPDFQYYTSDIGRMWPVGGQYSPAQRAIYGFIVKYHLTLLSLIRPGAMPSDVLDTAAEVMTPVIEQTHFSEPHHAEAARAALRFRGHLSHPVGMAVHDVDDYRTARLEPGIVFSVDPMLWIPEEHLYIRCEDTILVREDGIEILTSGAPLELDDVEATMREQARGLLKPRRTPEE